MPIRAFSLDFNAERGFVVPRDQKLHDMAVRFCAEYLRADVNLSDYRKVLVACEVDEAGQPVSVAGITCGAIRWDFPVWRATTKEAMGALIERNRAFLEDQGMRGGEVFVYIEPREPKESRCPFWRKWLRSVRAAKANRWSVQV